MKFAKSILTGAGAVVLTGLILAPFAPKAAHAIVATAVQVTNTAAAPAITQDVSRLAAQGTQAWCISNGGCHAFPDTSDAYTVPAGHTFMITSVDFVWEGTGAPTSLFYTVSCSPTGPQVGEWFLAGGAAPTNYIYPSGLSMPSGCTLGKSWHGGGDSYDVILRGYLTTN